MTLKRVLFAQGLVPKSQCGFVRCSMVCLPFIRISIKIRKCKSDFFFSDSHSEQCSMLWPGSVLTQHVTLHTSVQSSCHRCFAAHILEAVKWVLGSWRLRWSPCEHKHWGPAANWQTSSAVGLESQRHGEMCDKQTTLEKLNLIWKYVIFICKANNSGCWSCSLLKAY